MKPAILERRQNERHKLLQVRIEQRLQQLADAYLRSFIGNDRRLLGGVRAGGSASFRRDDGPGWSERVDPDQRVERRGRRRRLCHLDHSDNDEAFAQRRA